MVSANVKWVQKVHCFVLWGCAWDRLVPHLEFWAACTYAGPALFCERIREIGPKSVYKCLWWVRMWNECKRALFCMVGMCLGSIGTTHGIVGCVPICWTGTFLWRGQQALNKRSTNAQQTLNKRSTNSQQTLNKRPTNCQQTLNKRSANAQQTHNKRSTNAQKTFNKRSTNKAQQTLNKRSTNA